MTDVKLSHGLCKFILRLDKKYISRAVRAKPAVWKALTAGAKESIMKISQHLLKQEVYGMTKRTVTAIFSAAMLIRLSTAPARL